MTKKINNDQVEQQQQVNYMARLVSNGFTPKDGNDYKETSSPVSKSDSLYIIIAKNESTQ